MSVTVHSAPSTVIAPDLLERWRKIPVAVAVDLSEAIRQIDPAIRPLKPVGTQPLLFGLAITARCEPPDFGAVVHAIDLVSEGNVLVIAAGGDPSNAMIGEILGGHLYNKGTAGVVCDGAIRDVASLAAFEGFPVYCRSINPRGPVGLSRGGVNQDVMIGSCQICPGDLLMGDDDGLVVLSPEQLAKWIDAAEARLVTEENWVKRLDDGESIQALFDL